MVQKGKSLVIANFLDSSMKRQKLLLSKSCCSSDIKCSERKFQLTPRDTIRCNIK